MKSEDQDQRNSIKNRRKNAQNEAMSGRRFLRTFAATVLIVALGIAAAYAQQIWAGGYGRMPPRFPTRTTFSGGFNFCRAMFMSDRREKQGWSTDYPGADINFSIRISELTKINVTWREDSTEGPEPDAVVVRLTDDDLFKCPFVLMEDAGTIHLNDLEAQKLQDYLVKGGFLLVSDYHGTWAQQQFDDEIARVLPPGRYPTIELTPPLHGDHPIWHTMFNVTQVPQMASINTWRRTGDIIERWNEDGAPPDVRGIADEHGNLMVLMVHNTDLPDPWEREGEDKDYFFRFSPDAYAVGINILLYAMSH
jgi:hypothetical protein